MTRSYNLDATLIKDLWTPDVLFTEEKSGRKHMILKDNSFLDINPNGRVMLSQRLTLRLHCFMNFLVFPFDSQLCKISLETMGKSF